MYLLLRKVLGGVERPVAVGETMDAIVREIRSDAKVEKIEEKEWMSRPNNAQAYIHNNITYEVFEVKKAE